MCILLTLLFLIVWWLIGLSAGVVSSVDEILPYGGKTQPIKAWERDMSLREAIKVSNVSVYQEFARRIGVQNRTRTRDALPVWLGIFLLPLAGDDGCLHVPAVTGKQVPCSQHEKAIFAVNVFNIEREPAIGWDTSGFLFWVASRGEGVKQT